MTENKTEIKKIFNQYANKYADKYGDVSAYYDGFDFFCDKLKSTASILELGCGPGNITNYILERRPDLELLGFDLAPNMIEIAKKENPSAMFKVQDVRMISKEKQTFDGVLIGFCAPYLSKNELEGLIKDTATKLNYNAYIYLSTMEGNYSLSGYQYSSDGASKLFIHFHEQLYIKEFFKKNGLKVIWEKQQPFYENGKVRYNDYVIIGQKIK